MIKGFTVIRSFQDQFHNSTVLLLARPIKL